MLRSVRAVSAQRECRHAGCLLRAALASVTSSQTVLSSTAPPGGESVAPPPSPLQSPRPPPQPPRRAWPTGAAVTLALTASLGGVYIWKKKQTDVASPPPEQPAELEGADGGVGYDAMPAHADAFPERVEYLVAGAGTAAFAALRALRARRPDARILLVGREPLPPYMRPPLSKELWREPQLPAAADGPLNALAFMQWNGRKRPLLYEPPTFYTPVERLGALTTGGAAVATGWTVAQIDVANRRAVLRAPGRPPVTVAYEACLLATGSEPHRLPVLAAAAQQGRALALRTVHDALRLAKALEDERVRTVVVVGGGLLACELSAALAQRLQARARVVMLVRESAPLHGLLPEYLQQEAARRLHALGVTVLAEEEVHAVDLQDEERLVMTLSSGAALEAQLAVEAVGARVDPSLAAASGLELDEELGGVRVSAELQARAGVWAAGDAACWHDPGAGRRRRVQHHDHAVLSGRRAAHNMAAAAEGAQPQPYTLQPMFWSELGPQLGYEAIGDIDSRLPTVGVFAAEAVVAEGAGATADGSAAPEVAAAPEAQRYSRGVVFYLRESRVVGVLLWNLFNRMHIARQVLARGQFDDLLEVGKLFAPHDDD